MSSPKNINLFLIDGTASGRIKCTISGRTGVIFKIPRKDYPKCKEREDLKHDAIYFLLGEDKVYIGQAGSRKNGKGILNRLSEHDRDASKDFWTETIIFNDSSFGSTEISWLENKFCNMAIKAARYVVENGNDPSPGNITEEKESELKEHAAFAQLILSAIGYKIFEPKKNPTPSPQHDDDIFYLSRKVKALGRTINAQMKITPTGYKVLAGSDVSPIESENLSAPMKKLRHSDKVANWKLLEDIEFTSPSSAAEFVVGNHVNGKEYWKKNGVQLKDLQEGK